MASIPDAIVTVRLLTDDMPPAENSEQIILLAILAELRFQRAFLERPEPVEGDDVQLTEPGKPKRKK